jgi:hypothetical protein
MTMMNRVRSVGVCEQLKSRKVQNQQPDRHVTYIDLLILFGLFVSVFFGGPYSVDELGNSERH